MENASDMKKYKPWRFRQRLPLALLVAFALPFTVVLYGVFEIYAGNRAEFDFALGDVMAPLLLIFAACFVILSAILLPLRGRVFDIVFAVVFWITVMAYLQGNFLNFGISSLSADVGNDSPTDIWLAIVNIAIWLIALVGCILAVTLIKSRDLVHVGAIILLVMVIAIQLVNFVTVSLTTDVLKPKNEQTDLLATNPETEESQSGGAVGDGTEDTEDGLQPIDLENLVLTVEDLYTVSSKNNIIVFMVDRFDADYVARMKATNPEFFDGLTGFTYYSDNISLYPRTYPAVTSMITGVENDFSTSASEYFESAYQGSEFLKALKDNGYRINIYGDKFYTYRDAKELYGVADNISVADGYEVIEKGRLVTNLIGLSSYRYVPLAAKGLYTLASTSFKGFVKYDAIYDEFLSRDYEFYSGLVQNGLSVRDDVSTYSFICMNGCHSPYYIDKDGQYEPSGTSLEEATAGTFKIIYDYIDMLRELGLYESSTIIISGDHADIISDDENPSGKRQTALFFKPAGKSDQPLAYSSAQVSQENLIPSIVASAGLKTDIGFGDCYWEIEEGVDRERKYLFVRYENDENGSRDDKLVEYRIFGDGSDFSNWEIVSETSIGYYYK